MFEAAAKALPQMSTPPFRWVLFKSIGLALILIVLWHRPAAPARLARRVAASGRKACSAGIHDPLALAVWMFSIAAGFGIVRRRDLPDAGRDRLRRQLLRRRDRRRGRAHALSGRPPGQPLPMMRAVFEGMQDRAARGPGLSLRDAVPAVCGLRPCSFFFFATSYLLGREYFLLAAMRFRAVARPRRSASQPGHRVRRRHAHRAFVSIPIVNLATPLFGMAFMVHMHKRLSGSRALIEARAS